MPARIQCAYHWSVRRLALAEVLRYVRDGRAALAPSRALIRQVVRQAACEAVGRYRLTRPSGPTCMVLS